MKFLIVDDSYDFRQRIRDSILRHNNVFVVGECDNGIKAIQLLKETEPDMIILDIQMPLMNGIQVLKQIKEQGIETISCILTNFTSDKMRKKCLAEGADYFFNKSEDFEEFNLTVENELRNYAKKICDYF